MIHPAVRYLVWGLLALPAALMIAQLARGETLAMDLLHPSGENAVRLLILALLPGPLSEVFGSNRMLRAWLALRRNLGVAAFAYGLLHLAFYLIDMRFLPAIVEELELPGIWTGWLALALMAVPAAVSFDAAMRTLRRRWKLVQRLVYPALFLTLAHWLLLDWEWQPALVHAAPVLIAWLLRFAHRLRVETRRSYP